jgi:hypothetical protein
MLALFINHPPLFVAGEIALGLSLTLFVGALIAATVRGASEISQVREAGDPNPTICSSVFGRSSTRSSECSAPRSGNEAGGSIQTAIPAAPTRRLVLRQHSPDARAVSPRKFPTNPSTALGSTLLPDRTRRKSIERPPSRPGGRFALMREVGTTPASLAP